MRIGIAVDGSSPSRAGQVSVIAVAEPAMVIGAEASGHVPSVAWFMELLADAAEARAHLVVEHAAERLIGLPCPVMPVIHTGHPVARGAIDNANQDGERFWFICCASSLE